MGMRMRPHMRHPIVAEDVCAPMFFADGSKRYFMDDGTVRLVFYVTRASDPDAADQTATVVMTRETFMQCLHDAIACHGGVWEA